MTAETPGAKIFISCGQRLAEEQSVVGRIEEVVRELGFEPYVGVWDNTLEGLKENIFRELENSEYILFIDFKRHELRDGSFRGSVFSHQELAVASYLQIDALGFREAGLPNEGVSSAVQLNCKEFETRDQLPDMVRDAIDRKIKNGKWSPTWKAQLILERKPGLRPSGMEDPPLIWHIGVRNQHRSKTVHGCRAFLVSYEDLQIGHGFKLKPFELKWEGTTVPDAAIPPGSRRSFDAFEIYPEEPTRLKWCMAYQDTDKVWAGIKSAGKYRMQFAVTSQNFWISKATFELDLQPDPRNTALTLLEQHFGPTY
jgi:hypothetical protein